MTHLLLVFIGCKLSSELRYRRFQNCADGEENKGKFTERCDGMVCREKSHSAYLHRLFRCPPASKSFRGFTADSDTEHLELLYCIDALNEGIHANDVSGVILLCQTVSSIICKQQIGRALAAGKWIIR